MIRVISCSFQTAWLTYSPDLILCDFWLWDTPQKQIWLELFLAQSHSAIEQHYPAEAVLENRNDEDIEENPF